MGYFLLKAIIFDFAIDICSYIPKPKHLKGALIFVDHLLWLLSVLGHLEITLFEKFIILSKLYGPWNHSFPSFYYIYHPCTIGRTYWRQTTPFLKNLLFSIFSSFFLLTLSKALVCPQRQHVFLSFPLFFFHYFITEETEKLENVLRCSEEII